MELIVGIGEIQVSRTDDDLIKTFSLASCLGVVMYAPRIQAMAMAHMLLPCSPNKGAETNDKPARYVDTGMDALINMFQYRLGVKVQELNISVFGGAEASMCNHYNVSERNIEAVKYALKKHGLKTNRMETGGAVARTLTGYSRDGRIHVTPVHIGMQHCENLKGACL